MFLDNLSRSLLRLCDTEKLSYEQASERCGCSSRHFSNIVRKRTYPSLNVLEHICGGFGQTPNQLLGVTPPLEELSFRSPMAVTELRALRQMGGVNVFPVCPRCGRTLEREFQAYCDRCGQCLDWERFHSLSVLLRL